MPGLEDLYREIILDHYRSPRNRGELPSPPARRAEGFNPLCGDEVVVYVDVDDGTLKDIRISGQGCSISQSSASLMSGAVKGKSLPEVRDLIRTFKAMMSIHESSLDGDAETAHAGINFQVHRMPCHAQSGRRLPALTNWGQVSNQIGVAIQDILTGKTSTKDLLARLQKLVPLDDAHRERIAARMRHDAGA